ncbi:hypothetical protein U9M48_027057 [Paspalum notatum var. saurae]|uniref:F-box domain-containing protein n=1 Tax=Paspalum notatum var. saurae TaxID=547442 RepID=A0AAQ3TS50_PASNO
MGCCLAHSDSVDIGLHLKRSSLEQKEGMADLLPEDVLANIIRRLAPRHLAISRISLSNGKYQVIKPPVGFEWSESEPTDL